MEKKDGPVEKVVIDEEELDGIDIDGILNLAWNSVHRVGMLESESSRLWRKAY